MSNLSNVNTTESMAALTNPINREKKSWDDMTDAERTAAHAEARKLMTEADKPDPVSDRNIDKTLDKMKTVFGMQKRHLIMLYQINGAMKAQGIKDLAPVQLGINGYIFTIPRGVPVELPEDAIKVLYQAGEITPQVMLALGLASRDEVQADAEAAQAMAQQIANKIKPMEM